MRASPERFEKLHAEELRMLRDLAVAEPERELPLFRAGMQGMAMLYLLNPEVFPLRTVAESFMQKYGVLGGFDE